MIQHVGEKSLIDFEVGEMLLVNKPLQWTSFDVVGRLRGMFRIRKIGHAGTLDPRATGLLIVCTGKMTKSIDQFSALEKEYVGTMELGAVTASFDAETEVVDRKDFSAVTTKQILDSFESFKGQQFQIGPMYSARKFQGKRLYKYARKGKTIERQPREIFISKFDLLDVQLPFVKFRVVCSKGTYIRTLVNDCGAMLGCGAYLTQLTRTRIGEYDLDMAIDVEQLHTLENKIHTRAH